LFSPDLLDRIRGDHPRKLQPDDDRTYVAGVDIAGQVTEDGKPILNDRDETVVTIAEVEYKDDAGTRDRLPTVTVVHHAAWRGLSFPQQQKRLAALLFEHWRVSRVTIDATGVGAGAAAILLASRPKSVEALTFTAPEKSRLGYELLAS